MHTDTAFWNRIARRYADTPVRDTDAYERTLNRTRAYLHENDRVVELGCGTGSTALTLAPMVADYLATDVASEMVAIGQERAAAHDLPQLRFGVAGAEAPVAGQASRDVVIAFNLLHLVPDRVAVLAQAHEMLKPGSYFISKTVCLGGQGWWFHVLLPLLRAVGKAPPVDIFTPETLQQEIRAAGFDIVEADDHNQRPACRFVVARKV